MIRLSWTAAPSTMYPLPFYSVEGALLAAEAAGYAAAVWEGNGLLATYDPDREPPRRYYGSHPPQALQPAPVLGAGTDEHPGPG